MQAYASSPTSTSTPLPLLAISNGGLREDGYTPCTKRVKFSDQFSSDVSGFLNGQTISPDPPVGVDVVDQNMNVDQDEETVQIIDVSSVPRANGVDTPLGESEGKKKRRRHRRHKDKSKKKLLVQDENEKNNANKNDKTDSGSGDSDQSQKPPKPNGEANVEHPSNSRSSSEALVQQEYDADESEIDHSQISLRLSEHSASTEESGKSSPKSKKRKQDVSAEKFEFLSPNSAMIETGYRRARNSTSISSSGSNKSKPISKEGHPTQFFSSTSNSYSSSPYVEIDNQSTGQKRKDTPALPRILVRNAISSILKIKNCLLNYIFYITEKSLCHLRNGEKELQF